MLGFISAIALTVATFSSALASNTFAQTAQIYRNLSVTNSTGLNFETSGAMEKINTTSDGWMMQAGGDVASTHYARARYRLPEAEGVVLTYFYAKAVIVLPPDFYSQQKASFRILNTDNYPTTLNGASVGASNANELRVAVYIFSDHKLRVQVNHETGTKLTLYTAPTVLPTGEHTFELAGDVANAAPWYLKVDGVVVASGVQRLSTDDMADSERVITRIVAGIDGAADQDTNSMNLLVKSLEFANYDISSVTATSVPPIATQISTMTATSTLMASPTATQLSTPVSTATLPTATVTSIPFTATASPLPSQPAATNTVIPQPVTSVVDIRVSSGNDDVEERSSRSMYMNGSDLELIYDTSAQVVGIRFNGVKIPKGATITNAYIQFKVDEASSATINLTINGEASANAPAFANTSRNVSMRPRTSNKVTWSPSSWSKVGEMGNSQRTPNLNSIIQEIINQSNWNSGNSMVMIIMGTSGKRVAESFEGSASGAPLLHIEFSVPVPAVP
jgi:hypothetical protein